MSKVQIQPEMIKMLLSQLPTTELESFVQVIADILSNRKKEYQGKKEATLLLQINNCALKKEDLDRFLQLRNERQISELPPKKLDLFFTLLKKEQQLQVKRIQLLKQLADLKGISVMTLMNQLEITAPASV